MRRSIRADAARRRQPSSALQTCPAQPMCEYPHHLQRELRTPHHQIGEAALVQGNQHAARLRDRGRAARLGVEQGHLAQDRASADHLDQLAVDQNADLSLGYDIHLVAPVALGEDQLSGRDSCEPGVAWQQVDQGHGRSSKIGGDKQALRRTRAAVNPSGMLTAVRRTARTLERSRMGAPVTISGVSGCRAARPRRPLVSNSMIPRWPSSGHAKLRMLPLARLALAVTLAALMSACPLAQAQSDNLEPQVRKFIGYMARTHGFDARALRTLLAGAQPNRDVLRAISAPATGRPWYQFRPLCVDDMQVTEGVQFWYDNAALLERTRHDF